MVWVIVVAAGTGSRFGAPKQYERLGPGRLLDHAVTAARGPAGAPTVGAVVTMKDGRRVKVSKVYQDGSFDGDVVRR